MTGFAAVCIGLAAVAVWWPEAGRRSRRQLRALLAVAGETRRQPGAVPSRPWRSERLVHWIGRVSRGDRPVIALAAVAAVLLGALLGSAVAAVVVGGYGLVAARLTIRRRAERARTAHRAKRLDLLAAAAADLRAGLPAATALAGVDGGADPGPDDPVRSRALAAVVLAEQTGAPLADVLERIEADARGLDRARAAAAAQTAGSRATAWLLAALPLGGIALGYAIGSDPLAVLLHTPIGAACAFGAAALQLAGLAWAGRLTRSATAVAS